MKKEAAERKQLERMRAKEKAEADAVGRVTAVGGGMEMPGESSSSYLTV